MRWVLLPAALVLGAAVGTCVVAVHGYLWGLLLGLAATAATLVALPGGPWLRLPFGLAWAGCVLWLSLARAEGDYLVAADASGYVVLIAVPVVIVAGTVGIRGPRARDEGTGAARDSGS